VCVPVSVIELAEWGRIAPAVAARRSSARQTPAEPEIQGGRQLAAGIAPAQVDILVIGYADSPSVAGTVGLVRDGDRVIVVDPGMVRSRSLILDPLERLGISADEVTHVFVSHHHLDHTVNIALFRQAEVVDFRSARRDDQVNTHQGEGFKLGPNTTIWVTPGHTPQDASLVVDTAEGRHAFTHLWWRSDRTPEMDPYSTDPAELARNRQRLLDGVDVVIPGHGAPFRVR
jgi:glyoxylase-like metal-dependent hydrolase (beta-lactamase superfamily II)